MNEVKRRTINRSKRSNKVRSKVVGTTARPRLIIRISNRNAEAQVINDEKGITLASASTHGEKSLEKASMTDKVTWLGTEIAKASKTAKVKQVVFDRGYKPYQGRVKTAADAARKEGLEF